MNRRPKEKFDFEEAKEKALNLLEFRAHSRKEIFDKLRRFTDAQTAGEVADALEEAGLINDEEYAYQCAHDLMELRFFGGVTRSSPLSFCVMLLVMLMLVPFMSDHCRANISPFRIPI